MKKNNTLKVTLVTLVTLITLVTLVTLQYHYKVFYVNYKSEYKLNNLDKKKILIFTIETRDLKIVDIHNKNISEYSDIHNYKYVFLNNYKNKSIELPVYWWKLQYMLDLLNNEEEYDYFLWLDSDAFFVDYTIPLESLIEKSPHSSIFIGYDHNYLNIINIFTYCAGVFMLKNDKTSKNFILDCIEDYIENYSCIINNKHTLNGVWAGECYEQGVMNKLIKTKYKENTFKISESFVTNSVYLSENTVISHIFGDKDICYNKITNFLKKKHT